MPEPPAFATAAGERTAATALPALPRLERTWVRRATADETAVQPLREALDLPDVVCRLLSVRGYADPDAARSYLKPRLDRLHDPFGMADMTAAVDRLDRALRAGERILVHGDYDVDGICSTALFTRVLRSLDGDVTPFTPYRLRDGYDLTAAGVAAAQAAGAKLILTADCGTVAHGAIRSAAAAGIDVVVTDHHTPGPDLPAATALVNPNRADCEYPDKSLAGAGVAYKLCQALLTTRGADPDSLWYYLDLVALATIADLAPLKGENRVLSRFGLRLLPQTRNPGLRALLASAGIDTTSPIAAGQVSHVLAPRINAVGRMGDAGRGVALLLTDDDAEAARLAAVLEEENRVRKAVDRQTLAEALDVLCADYDPDRDYGIVLAASGWHPGVIGIVASRVVERVHRPTILIAIDAATGKARGSARSIPAFHLYEAIRSCGDLLERFGGHRQAAGLEIRPDRIAAFRTAFNEHAASVLGPADVAVRVPIDLEIRLGDADTRLVELIRHFGPFGIANPSPSFLSRAVKVARPPRIVRDEHAKLMVADESGRLDVIGFGMADLVRDLREGDPIDMVYHLQMDEWNGRRRPQAKLVDLRPSR